MYCHISISHLILQCKKITCLVVLCIAVEFCDIRVSWDILWSPNGRAHALYCTGTCYSPRETLQVEGFVLFFIQLFCLITVNIFSKMFHGNLRYCNSLFCIFLCMLIYAFYMVIQYLLFHCILFYLVYWL